MEDDKEFNYECEFTKIEEDKDGTIFIAGIATTETRDHDGEVVDLDSVRGVWDEYRKGGGVIRYMHGKAEHNRAAVGKVVDEYTTKDGKTYKTEFTERGPFIVAQLSNANDTESIRTKVNEGIIRGFSIGGRARRVKTYDATLKKDVSRVITTRLSEISLVDLPANKDSYFEVLKMACVGENCPLNTDTEPIEKKEESKPVEAIGAYDAEKHYNDLIKEGYNEVEAKVLVYNTERLLTDAIYDKEREIEEIYHTLMSLGRTEESAHKAAKKIMDEFVTYNRIKKSETMDFEEINSEMRTYIEKLETKIQSIQYIYDHVMKQETTEPEIVEEVVEQESVKNDTVAQIEIDLTQLE